MAIENMEIRLNHEFKIKKVFANVADHITLEVFSDNTATVVQLVHQNRPSTKHFYNHMDKQSTEMNKQMRMAIADHLVELGVNKSHVYNTLNGVEVLFFQFPDHKFS